MRSLGRFGGIEATDLLRDCVQENDIEDAEWAHGIRALATINTAEAKASLEALDADVLAAPVAEELSDALERMSPDGQPRPCMCPAGEWWPCRQIQDAIHRQAKGCSGREPLAANRTTALSAGQER